jgi:glycosyltransferase involved in cell wall biosynthesis
MRVGVDATSWGNERGYGRFARSAVERLVALDPETTYVLIAPPHEGHPLPAGCKVLRVPGRAGAPRPAGAARPPGELARLGLAARRARLDVLLFPSVYTWFPAPGVPTVVGVHDVIASTLPQLTLPSRRAHVLWTVKETLAVRTAARVFTVSRAAREVVARRWKLDPEDIAIVPEAPAAVFWPRDGDAAERHRRAVGLAPDEPFLLFAGGISPHKNLTSVVGALALLRDAGRPAPRLVAVGDLDDTRFLSAAGDVRRRIERLSLSDRVLLPGFVSDEALAALYSTATAVVIPSLAEGFGLPAVEAAACGAPLILSDLPAHRETLDEAALFVAPQDEQGFAAVIERLAGDAELRADLAARARRTVASLSWERAAGALREVLIGAR